MKIGARIQSSIEILSKIFDSHIPADNQITNYFRTRKYIGSHDRRYISELVYTILRNYIQIEWYTKEASWKLKVPDEKARAYALIFFIKISDESLRDESIDSCFIKEIYHPAPINKQERMYLTAVQNVSAQQMPVWVQYNVPEEFYSLLKAHMNDEDLKKLTYSLSTPASLDLRVNILKTTREEVLKEFEKQSIPATPTPWSPIGIRLQHRRPLPDNPLWKSGVIEVQDEGSQILALLVDAKPGMCVLDLCAGAGGKTLAIGMAMENKGQIFATDISELRLSRAKERLRRAGLHNVSCKLLDPSGLQWLNRQSFRFDRVLIDAPCSGTGTWRRNPDQKYKFSLQGVEELVEVQQGLLNQARKLVKPGGHLIYATCSLLPNENEDQVEWFLKNNPGWQVVAYQELDPEGLYPKSDQPYLRLLPSVHETDGFFAAVLIKSEGL